MKWLAKAGIELVRGHAEFTGVRELTVTAEDGSVTELTARHAVAVSTGSLALLPDIPGLRDIEPWTSREATSAKEVPASLAIIGGGVVGAEMATAYAGLGTKVTLIARSGLLTREEPFAGDLVRESLEGMGATVLTGVGVVEAHAHGARRGARPQRRRRASSPSRCSSPSAARRARATSGWMPSASNPAAGSRPTTRCG